MRFQRRARLARASRSSIVGAAGGDGGGGLPERTTAPTFEGISSRGGGSSTTTNVSASASIGSMMVALGIQSTVAVTTLTGPTLKNQAGTEYNYLRRQTDSADWTVNQYGWQSSWIAGSLTAIAAGATETVEYANVVGSSANTTVGLMAFADAEDAILVDSGQFGVDAGWDAPVGNVATFPDSVVPTGYVFVYAIIGDDDRATDAVWANATERSDISTNTGTGAAMTTATGTTGVGVTVTCATIQSDYTAGYPQFGVILAIPGTS